MRNLRAFSVLTSLAIGCVSAAFGGAGTITTVVTPLQNNTTYSSGGSKPLVTYVAYTVKVSNDGGNTVNNIRFTAKTTLPNGNGEKAVFSGAEGGTCAPTVGGDGTEVLCTIGQLTAGTPAPTVVLFFTAPVKGTPTSPDTVVLTGRTLYAEGTGGINSPPDNSINEWQAAAVTLGTPNPTVVKSAVPKSGGEFFTGAGGIPVVDPDPAKTDLYTSSVKFDPLSTPYAVLKIEESNTTDSLCIGGQHFKTCFTTLLNAPQVLYSVGQGFLTETIRVHPDDFVKGAKMSTVVWQYTPTDDAGVAVGGPVTVGMCASETTPNSNGVPCQTKPVVCYKNNSPLAGICEWTFINIRNGLMRGY